MRTIGAALVLAVACGGEHGAVERVPDARVPDAPDVFVEPRDTGTGGAPSAAEAMTIAPADAAVDAPPSVTTHLPLSYSAPIPPGGESNACVFGATVTEETWVSGWSAKLAFVHHTGVWISKAGTPVSCSGGTFLFTALTADFRQQIPVDGGALRIPAGSQLILDIHRLNTTTDPQTAHVDMALDVAETHSVEVFNSGVDGHTISVPPQSEKVLTYSCIVPASIKILSMLAHTHSHTKSLSVKSNGAEVYNSPNWAEPQTKYFEPFTPGTVELSCDVVNDLPTTMVYGLNRDTAEMCQVYMLMLGGAWSCSK